MSVRRLADDAVQPDEFAFAPSMAKEVETWISKYPQGRQQSAVIPLLMLAQEQEGWVTRAAIEAVAEKLEMPLIRVLEVATFYTQFQLQPVGTRAHVQVCGTTPCMLRGANDLIALCKKKINSEPFKTNEAGTLSWEEVECQGACVNAPMVMIFKDAYEDLTVERLDEIIDAFEAGNGDSIEPGPQIDRHLSAPASGLTSLLDDDGSAPAASKKGRSTNKGKSKAGKTADADDQAMKKVAKPVTDAPEGDERLADPDKAEGPGRRKRAKTGKAGTTTDETSSVNVPVADKSGKTGKTETSEERAKRLNPTMQIAETAKPKSAGKQGSGDSEIAKRLADVDDDGYQSASRAKPSKGGKKQEAAIGTDMGTTMDSVKGANRVRPKEPTPEKDVDDGNPTMKIAATATGRAKRKASDDAKAAKESPAKRAGEGTSGSSDVDRPEAISKPAEPDDLKMISGIGPKIEGILHELGIWKWSQIASWTEKESDWVNGYLRFKGRIEREDWVRQADALARGGRDEYVKVFGKEPR